jgi:hypothetical protein
LLGRFGVGCGCGCGSWWAGLGFHSGAGWVEIGMNANINMNLAFEDIRESRFGLGFAASFICLRWAVYGGV